MIRLIKRGLSTFTKNEFWRKTPIYKDITTEQFSDYSWQNNNSMINKNYTSILEKNNVKKDIINDISQSLQSNKMSIRVTPYIMSLVNWNDFYNCPIAKQFIPTISSFQILKNRTELDSLHEKKDSKVDGIVHRYPNKILFLANNICPVYCIFCTRSYAIGEDTDTVKKDKSIKMNKERWNKCLDYIKSNDKIEDVLISGGDGFMLPHAQLDFLGKSILDIKHVKRLRLATKGIAVLPMKIITDTNWTDAVIGLNNYSYENLKHFAIQTHFNHPKEISHFTEEAMKILMKNKVLVRNQSVFLKGINDNEDTMHELIIKLSNLGIIPYYVYLCDSVPNGDIYRTSIQSMIDVEKKLKGRNSGYMSPSFIIDLPNGGGKKNITSFESYKNGKAHYKSYIRNDSITDFYYEDPIV